MHLSGWLDFEDSVAISSLLTGAVESFWRIDLGCNSCTPTHGKQFFQASCPTQTSTWGHTPMH